MQLYIHIPFCISKCAYCDFFSRPYQTVPDEYIKALCNELAFRIKSFNVTELSTIYIGGGTPSLLTGSQLETLFSKIRSLVKLDHNAEITVEINPDDVSEALLASLESCGVNRLSCGIQTMNDAALKKACRRADRENNLKALGLLERHWKAQLSLDLISGLPLDDEKNLLQSLEEVCSVNPCHISLYSLTIEEGTPFGMQLESGLLSYDFDKADKLWLAGRDYLEKKGYEWYEVSNFCRPGKECLHNLGYWNHKSYLGCGSGACGTVYNEDGSGERWTNSCNIKEYIDVWEQSNFRWLSSPSKTDVSKPQIYLSTLPQTSEHIDLVTSQFEFFMMGLRKVSGVSEEEYKKIFGQAFPEHFNYLFEKWEAKKLCLRRGDGRLAMSREGMLFLNRFLEELF